jgi:hypothetical protein
MGLNIIFFKSKDPDLRNLLNGLEDGKVRRYLDNIHSIWDSSYGYFNQWRRAVARAGGYDFEKFFVEEDDPRLLGDWKETPKNPLEILFYHSDCDGRIYPQQAIALAEALEKVAKVEPSPYDEFAEETLQFANGLRMAADLNEAVEFG